MDVMRNVASKHIVEAKENAEVPKLSAELGHIPSEKTWTSLPAVDLAEQQHFREDENVDEGLQEVRSYILLSTRVLCECWISCVSH